MAPDPVTRFEPLLSGLDAALLEQYGNVGYFELGLTLRPNGQRENDMFRESFSYAIPSARIFEYATYTKAQHDALPGQDKFKYDAKSWYADKSGHLGSLGLDYLGEVIAHQFPFPTY